MAKVICQDCGLRLTPMEAVKHDDETRHTMTLRGVVQQFDQVRREIAEQRAAMEVRDASRLVRGAGEPEAARVPAGSR